MKRRVFTLLAVIAVLLALAVPGDAERRHGGGRGPRVHGHGGGLLWEQILGFELLNWGLWELSRQHFPPPQPPVIIERERDRYLLPPPQTVEPSSVYYCTDPQGYYPYVDYCYGEWTRVAPPLPEE